MNRVVASGKARPRRLILPMYLLTWRSSLTIKLTEALPANLPLDFGIYAIR